MFCGSGWMEGLGFNLCVAPTDSLGPPISLRPFGWGSGRVTEGEGGCDLSQYQN